MCLVSSCSCLCPIHWNQVLSHEWRYSWGSADRRCSNYIWVINNCITYQRTSYIRGLTVIATARRVGNKITESLITFTKCLFSPQQYQSTCCFLTFAELIQHECLFVHNDIKILINWKIISVHEVEVFVAGHFKHYWSRTSDAYWSYMFNAFKLVHHFPWSNKIYTNLLERGLGHVLKQICLYVWFYDFLTDWKIST